MTAANPVRQVFLSYCHSDAAVADRVENALQGYQLAIQRDVRDARDYTSIKDFMRRIKSADFVILLVSDAYLKSQSCMFEILELLRNDDFKERILPIVITTGGVHIYSKSAIPNYVGYWTQQYDELRRLGEPLKPEESIEFNANLRTISAIRSSVGQFIDAVQDLKSPSLTDLEQCHFQPIVAKIDPERSAADHVLFGQCLPLLSEADRPYARDLHDTGTPSAWREWVTGKIVPKDSADFASTRMMWLARMLDEHGIGSPFARSVLKSTAAVFVHEWRPLAAQTTRSRYGAIDQLAENALQRLIGGMKILATAYNASFNMDVFFAAFWWLDKADQVAAFDVFAEGSSTEMGDWFLQKLMPESMERCRHKELSVLAKVIGTMGGITGEVIRARDLLIARYKSGFSYDPEYNDYEEGQKRAVIEALTAIGDELSKAALRSS